MDVNGSAVGEHVRAELHAASFAGGAIRRVDTADGEMPQHPSGARAADHPDDERETEIGALQLELRGCVDERMIQEGLEPRDRAVEISEFCDAALVQRARRQFLSDALEGSPGAFTEQMVDEQEQLLAVVERDGIERRAGLQPIERRVRKEPARDPFGQQRERSRAELALESFQNSS